jgi:PAS domain S-box-containing protein
MLKLILNNGYKTIPHESFIEFIAIAVALGTVGVLWRYRKSVEVKYLIIIEILAAIWAFTCGIEFLSNDLDTKKFWSQMSYFGIAFLPVSYFLFTTAFSQKSHIITPRTVALLSVIPFITIPLVLTNDYHSLVWKNVTLNAETNMILIEHGSWFWIFWAYALTLIFAGLYNLIQSIYKFTAYYKSQVGTLLIATLIPLAGNMMYVTGINPIPGFDWTPVFFVFTGLVITFGIVKYRMFDLVPFARNRLIDTMSDGVIVVNSEGFIEDYNPAVTRIFNLKSKSIIRNRFSNVFLHFENLQAALETHEESLQEIESGKKNKKVYQVRVTPVFNRNLEFSGHLLQLNDVTSLKHTEKKLKEANNRLEAEVEERGRLIEDLDSFAHTVAHDLRNSLGSVYNLTEIIEECIRDGNTELLNEFSGHIKSSARKAMQITRELLLLATVNQFETEKKPLEMSRIFKEALNQVKELIKSSDAKISYPEMWPEALGYAPWVEEIWVNFLTNAIKYGGSPPEIKTGAELGTYTIRFWIRDNGNGIAPQNHHKLFKKYSRLEPEKAEGYGLGLSIVKRIVRKLGGNAGVESTGEQGEGALFWFELPAHQHPITSISMNEISELHNP